VLLEIQDKIAIVGLGYVGLPLAVEFGKYLDTVGFDIDTERVEELKAFQDRTLEVLSEEIKSSKNLSFSHDLSNIKDSNIYIVTVPTPIDKHKRPDLSSLEKASTMIAGIIKKNDIVIYESTVYPGATEEVCVPILEKISGLVFNKDFFCGYSPERINPGDKNHRLENITKITSGSSEETAVKVDNLYKMIIKAGTYKASSIKIAEAAKVIENTQRDVNIALINELAQIFNKLDIDTHEVLQAAETKWNFLPFKPGIVGGHCIGVDPYYLTHKSAEVGHHPEMILAGRRLNDDMPKYIVDRFITLMISRGLKVADSNILIMGLSFKENCPDIRNTKVIDIIEGLVEFNCNVDVYDPWVDAKDALKDYGISLIKNIENKKYDGILISVAHQEFKEWGVSKIRSYGKEHSILFDLKNLFNSTDTDGRL
jgi:UDP-N-acetyl-D-galactosamine dehydrogenase|tara:strand:- start:2701 stop:3978 length:1278 start_codon:yes stop_codon:yes gene_type:complete